MPTIFHVRFLRPAAKLKIPRKPGINMARKTPLWLFTIAVAVGDPLPGPTVVNCNVIEG